MPSERAWSTDLIAYLLPAKQDPAGVRRLEAAQDLEQGGLAGAVVTDQAQHLAAFQVQVHVDQRGHCDRTAWRCARPAARPRPPPREPPGRPALGRVIGSSPRFAAALVDVRDHRDQDRRAEDDVQRVGADPDER